MGQNTEKLKTQKFQNILKFHRIVLETSTWSQKMRIYEYNIIDSHGLPQKVHRKWSMVVYRIFDPKNGEKMVTKIDFAGKQTERFCLNFAH